MSTAVAIREDRGAIVVAEVKGLVEQRRAQLSSLLGAQVDVDRFITVALQAVSSRPDLLECDPLSILSAIRDSAYYNLEPTSALGEGAIVPYNDTKTGRKLAQFQPMFRGLMKLARRSGLVVAIGAEVVYEADTFDVDLGTESRITHKPAVEDRGKWRCVYAWARLSTGELVCPRPLNLLDIDQIRKQSQEFRSKGNNSNWVKWPDEMAKKSALKRLMKMLPLEAKAQEALALDNDADSRAADVARPSRTISAIHERLGIKPAPPGEPAHGEVESSGATPSPVSSLPPEPNQSSAQTAPSGDGGDSAPSPSPAPCGEFSKTLGKCVREAHEGTNHRNKAGETWA